MSSLLDDPEIRDLYLALQRVDPVRADQMLAEYEERHQRLLDEERAEAALKAAPPAPSKPIARTPAAIHELQQERISRSLFFPEGSDPQ